LPTVQRPNVFGWRGGWLAAAADAAQVTRAGARQTFERSLLRTFKVARSKIYRLTESVKLTGLQFTDVEAGDNSYSSSDAKALAGLPAAYLLALGRTNEYVGSNYDRELGRVQRPGT
jgi:hypothetical protein